MADDGIRSVVRGALSPHGEEDIHFELDGPGIRIGSKPMLGLSLALHELATNAVKYGALAKPGGRVKVSWHIADAQDGPRFTFEWREAGGPAVMPPARKGFGSRLIERSLGGYLGGTSELLYEPSGVIFRHRTTLAEVQAD